MKKYFLICLCSMSVISNANASAMLFVSLGMPTLTLRQYIAESHQYHIPLVLRGLIDNNYPETTKRIFDILHPKNSKPLSGGFEIDPLYFRKFQINTVPALFVQQNGQSSVIYGNVPIQKLIYLVATKSQYPAIKNQATHYLENQHA